MGRAGLATGSTYPSGLCGGVRPPRKERFIVTKPAKIVKMPRYPSGAGYMGDWRTYKQRWATKAFRDGWDRIFGAENDRPGVAETPAITLQEKDLMKQEVEFNKTSWRAKRRTKFKSEV